MAVQSRVERTKKRHQKVFRRFKYLFEEKRKRYDDSIQQVAEEFDYSPGSVERIIFQKNKEQG